MKMFVKWLLWIVIIAQVPVIFSLASISPIFALLSFFIFMFLSHNLEERHTSLCNGVQDLNTLNEKLKKGADLNAVGSGNSIALIETIKITDDINLIKTMIQKGANVNIKKGEPLSMALRCRKYEIAKILISSGADITTRDYIKCKDVESIKILLEAGASVSDSDLKWIIHEYGYSLSGDNGHYRSILFVEFAQILKLFIAYNANLSMFWRYLHMSEELMDKAFKYSVIAEYIKNIGSNDINPPKCIEMIDLFMNKIIEDELILFTK